MPNVILEGLTKEKRFAVKLHDSFCGSNHTDACGWYYEVKQIPIMGGYAYDEPNAEWNQYAHKRWLEKAIWAIKEVEGN